MSILGIHHITMVCSNAQRTVDFYSKLLGMKLVKKTVNFDAVNTYHLYFGDETGAPGSLLTFFEWPTVPRGRWGIGTTHHLALLVENNDAQLKWKRRLTDNGVQVTGPYDRRYFHSIYFSDPDGMILEIATRKPGWTVDESAEQLGTNVIMPPEVITHRGRDDKAIAAKTWAEPVPEITSDMALKRMHHITAISSDIFRTTDFYTGVLGFKVVKRTVNYDDTAWPHFYYAVGDFSPGTVMTYFGYGPNAMRYGSLGTGLTHHVAFAVKDDDAQREWQEKLHSQNVQVTEVLDRKYFKSIYFNDPDGHILEIATVGPGMLVDEDKATLGTNLSLPDWLEVNRPRIEQELAPITLS
ncbi:MAG: VOC family protein [Ignavibacteriae bacterium]|nr:VOC family protein [Ignavibacteriota bacterium]